MPSLAVGGAIHLITNKSVDIFIGPPCSVGEYYCTTNNSVTIDILAALPVAIQATFNNMPMSKYKFYLRTELYLYLISFVGCR
jgi:hypothetical protein